MAQRRDWKEPPYLRTPFRIDGGGVCVRLPDAVRMALERGEAVTLRTATQAGRVRIEFVIVQVETLSCLADSGNANALGN